MKISKVHYPGGKIQTIRIIRRMLLMIVGLSMTGCHTTMKVTEPGGRTTDMKIPWGNDISIPPVTVTASGAAIAAGRDLGGLIVNRGSEALLLHAVDKVTESQP